jgi:hypothetical protein
MIRSFVARASALLASATFAFLCIAPVAVSPAQGRTLNFPDTCTLQDQGGGNFNMSCGATPPGALNCSIIGAPGTVAPGAAISLTMSCSGGTTPYRYLWTPSGGSSGTLSTTVAATTTYSVTATDAANLTSTQGVTVTVSGGGGGGGGGGTGFCSAFANVLPIMNATWGQALSVASSASGPFGDGNSSVWVFRLTVPAGTPTSTVTGRFSLWEYGTAGTLRQMTLSTQACDFRAKDYAGVNGPLAVSNGTTVTVSYAVATPFIFGPAGLTPGQTYYVSVRNWQLDPPPQNSCPSNCTAQMNVDPALP